MSEPTPRQAVRAFVLTPERDVLLLRIVAPGLAPFWIAPGGGIEAGETSEDCLRRELREELGLLSCTIGPLVWRRRHTFDWKGRRICQSEDYHVVHASGRFVPAMADDVERETLDRFRWWRVDDLANATEPLTPLSVARIIGHYLSDGAPEPLPEMELLVD